MDNKELFRDQVRRSGLSLSELSKQWHTPLVTIKKWHSQGTQNHPVSDHVVRSMDKFLQDGCMWIEVK